MKTIENKEQYYFPIGSLIKCKEPIMGEGIYRIKSWMRCDIINYMEMRTCSDCITNGMIMKLERTDEGVPDPHGHADEYGVCILEEVRAEVPEMARVVWEVVND